MRVNLGWSHDPGNPCEQEWTWGDVVDKEVRLGVINVVQLDAIDSINIQDVTNPIWKKQFDGNGNLIDVNPPENDPVAANMKSGSFKIKATLDAFPSKPNWAPKVIFSWMLSGVSGTGEFTGWDGIFDITVPQKVGSYPLQLHFTFKDDEDNVVGSQDITRKLYVTYDTPIISPPKEIWLEKSTMWATDATTPAEVVSKLNQSVYTKSGWLYRDKAASWASLVEGTASQGNCVSFSDVWNNLTKVLGVSGSSTEQTKGSVGGFVTKPATALDGLKGNAHPAGAAIDRWVFGMHQVGKYNPGGYYDPTFGAQYGGIFDFIEWHFTGVTGTDADGFYFEADGHKAYPRNFNPPWGDWEYHSPGNQNNPESQNGANFTGNYSEQGEDPDADGIYDFLEIEADVNVSITGNYSIFGLLKSGETLITSRSGIDPTSFSAYYLSAEPGIKTVTLSFSGEDIYNKGIEGSYTIYLLLLDENGVVIDSRTFDTSLYSPWQFGQIPARIISALDHGEDTDSNGLYDYLTAEISIRVRNSMSYGLEGSLYSQGNLINNLYTEENLAEGNNVVECNFSGIQIEKSQLNGPYTLIVNLHDGNGHQIDQQEFETLAYQYTDFEKSGAKFSGFYSDYGTDTDEDGLYNYLRVEVGVDAITPGDYSLLGWLSDGQGNAIAYAGSEGFLDVGSGLMFLDFNGLTIHDRGLDGPYLINYVILKDAKDMRVDYREDAYTTSLYHSTDFQKPEKRLVVLTGNYWDHGTDIDADGTFDYLTVNAEVMLANPGYTVIKARLMDTNGGEIVWAENTAYLEANVPQITSLNFDGKAIFSHRVNGPYYLRDVYIYHTGDPTQPDYNYEAYVTADYGYWEFGTDVDFDSDGKVNFTDFAILAAHWLDTCSGQDWCGGSDSDHSGRVDFLDLLNFVDNWLWYPADLDSDGDVDFVDYAAFAKHWMEQNCAEPDWCFGADLNKSGSVDLYDLSKLANSWLKGH
jgi:hypothetical protein